MSENISLKMGVKLTMGKNVCHILNIITYENGENELQST